MAKHARRMDHAVWDVDLVRLQKTLESKKRVASESGTSRSRWHRRPAAKRKLLIMRRDLGVVSHPSMETAVPILCVRRIDRTWLDAACANSGFMSPVLVILARSIGVTTIMMPQSLV